MGDTNPWRDLGYVKWYDPLSKLEDASSKEFKDAVREETVRWSAAIAPHKKAYAVWMNLFKQYYTRALPHTPSYAHERYTWRGKVPVSVQHSYGHRMYVWMAQKVYEGVNGFGTHPGDAPYYFVLRDIGNGAEKLELSVYEWPRAKPLWKRSPVGPNAAFKGSKIFYQSVENHLRYPEVFSVDAATGKHKTLMYAEHDKRFQIDLYNPPHQPDLFVHVYNALDQRLGLIRDEEGSVQWIAKAHSTLVPVSKHVYASNEYLVVHNESYRFPRGYLSSAQLVSSRKVYVTTLLDGCSNLYEFDLDAKAYTAIRESDAPCQIGLHSYSDRPTYTYAQPNAPTELCLGVERLTTFPEPLKVRHFAWGKAVSKDGTEVPYTIVHAVERPTKLVVEGYGAYGISSGRSYPVHWLAWLKKGYALAVAMPRGGRENGDLWYDGGRTAQRKQNTFDDTAAVIGAVQKRLHISPKQTLFYGRSAGGWLAAAIAQQYPDRIGAVYAEVPYVDVLRTTSNPELPLTMLEYDEFGNPIANPSDYTDLKRISPVDSVYLAPPESPTIVAKTAVNDVQVLPYEVLKWSKKLRAAGWTVHVGIDGDGGHFAAEASLYSQQAEDAVLLDAVLAPPVRAQTRRARSHASKGRTLRRKSS